MALTLDQTIAKQGTNWSSRLLSSQAFWVFVAIVVACIYLSFASKAFLTPQNVFNITRNFTFTAIIALGMTFVIITGGIDLSVGSVLCLCSMVIATTMHAGAPLYLGVTAALATGLAVGLFNGVLIAYLGFPSFVVTLGMLSAARSFAMIASNNLTVFQFGPDHDKLLALGGGSVNLGLFSISLPVVYTLVLAAIAGFVLRWTRFGRHVFAIGGNEHAATLSGIPVRQIKVAVFMISSLTAAIAGIVETGWLGAVTTNIGSGMELQVIAAAVIGGASLIGGAGTAIGALVGAALIEIIRNSLGLLGINPFWQGTVIGAAIIIAVAFERVRQLQSRE
jgi:ribose transport system permease protein